MPTHVEGVPEQLYEALRVRARSKRRSVAAEILEEAVPTPAELKRRQQVYQSILRLRKRATPGGPGPSAEELLREDRNR